MINSKKKSSSWQRILWLLQMEWSVSKRSIIISMASLLVCILTIAVLTHTSGKVIVGNQWSNSFVANGGVALAYLGMGFSLFYLVQQRINRSNTITYTLLPSNTFEKLACIFIEGLAALLAAFIISQLAYSLEVLLYPSILEQGKLFNYDNVYFLGKTGYQILLININFGYIALAYMLFFLSLALFCSIRFGKFSVSLFVFFMGGMLIIWGIDDQIMSLALKNENLSMDFVIRASVCVMYLIDLSLFVASYICLSKRQLK